jgi:hypothetical protein
MLASKVYLLRVRPEPAQAFVVKSGVRPERAGWDLNPLPNGDIAQSFLFFRVKHSHLTGEAQTACLKSVH